MGHQFNIEENVRRSYHLKSDECDIYKELSNIQLSLKSTWTILRVIMTDEIAKIMAVVVCQVTLFSIMQSILIMC